MYVRFLKDIIIITYTKRVSKQLLSGFLVVFKEFIKN